MKTTTSPAQIHTVRPPLVPGNLYGGAFQGFDSVTLALTANTLYAVPICLPQPTYAGEIGIGVSTAGAAGKLIRVGLWKDSAGYPGALVSDTGSKTADATGAKRATVDKILPAGWYWLGVVSDGAPTVRAHQNTAAPWLVGATSFTDTTNRSGISVAFTYAALPDPFTASATLLGGNIPAAHLLPGFLPDRPDVSDLEAQYNEGIALPTIEHVSGRMYPSQLGVAVTTFTLTLNVLYATPFLVPKKLTYATIGVECTTLSVGNSGRLGIYNDSSGKPSSLLLDAGTVSFTTTGAKSITINQSLDPGWYWLVLVANSSVPAVRAGDNTTGNYWLGGTAVTDVTNHLGYSAAFTYGVLSGADPFPAGSLMTTAVPRIMLGA